MKKSSSANIPVACTWSRGIGVGWEKPYQVRYASNIDDGPYTGMPLGGFGAGCIGRSHRGDFNLWHIDGGEHVFKSIPSCQFSVFEANTEYSQAYALSTQPPEDDILSAWKWYPANSQGTYHALYPRSWFVYEGVFAANLTCEQFSPIWADNYQESSYPVAVFAWYVENPTDAPLTLSIMLTWQNLTGWFTNASKSPQVKLRDDGSPVYEYQPRIGESQDNYNYIVENPEHLGCVLARKGVTIPSEEGEGEWCIAVPKGENLEVSYHTRWNPVGNGRDIWEKFAFDGNLGQTLDATPADANEQVAAAIAVKFTLQPGESLEIPFILSWNFPITEFAQGVKYYRRYTDFFGKSGRSGWAIASTGLKEYQQWREQIIAWQQPLLNRGDLPNWFKMALFNELYDLTAGGTLWSAASERDPIGQFAVLECLDYRWYESLDVRLYGSFALLMLFPELEKAVIRAFARAIPHEDPTTRVIGYYYTIGAESPQAPRKVKGATPHDLGAPNEHVWEKTNYTAYQDCNLWKDLGSDFVLQVYRDFLYTGGHDFEFLITCWPAIVETLDYLKTFDLDGDGIPENSGAPDQTFDDWRLSGISAYCGGLWLAALQSAIAIATILQVATTDIDPEQLSQQSAIWQSWLHQALPRYHEKLWNGQYYRLDSNSGSDVVMADQLCGQFYARLLGLADIVPQECILSTLKTIYTACYRNFHNGEFGVANGLRPDGSAENPNATHPLEVWTGINFGLAAFMVQMGMKAEAMEITETVVKQIYNNGLQFRTPEAITSVGTFRASTYLRAMAIWAIYQQILQQA
ncbi:GH116 family glycosyl hydrolase [Calothrix sp. NIES-3974]|uniref:GH116 family glycosyl hydrolase n=1 Tax=Calothrix sp. NIES-3974 TaxID=2005462 RepID=UPI000B5F8F10|nr:GH116 family glycosyl hydrolase [Calothrix sp. NIES-3974]BAZ06285.1 hypothetical protein NIES3974_29430 [Calothrix sp. NIES-3974]